jgi:hypothetical protein
MRLGIGWEMNHLWLSPHTFEKEAAGWRKGDKCYHALHVVWGSPAHM